MTELKSNPQEVQILVGVYFFFISQTTKKRTFFHRNRHLTLLLSYLCVLNRNQRYEIQGNEYIRKYFQTNFFW